MSTWRLIYDDQCPVCLAGVGKIRELDGQGMVELVPLSRVSEYAIPNLPDRTALANEMHVLTPDGEFVKGADAVALVSQLFPKSRFFGRILKWPLIRHLARPLYRLLARNRMKLTGLTGN